MEGDLRRYTKSSAGVAAIMGRRGIVRGLIVGLSAFVMALAVYLAIVVIGPFDFPWQRVTAMIQLGRPVVEGGNLRMTGTTDLPDGALIDYHFWSHDAIGEGPGRRRGGKEREVLLRGGRFRAASGDVDRRAVVQYGVGVTATDTRK